MVSGTPQLVRFSLYIPSYLHPPPRSSPRDLRPVPILLLQNRLQVLGHAGQAWGEERLQWCRLLWFPKLGRLAFRFQIHLCLPPQ